MKRILLIKTSSLGDLVHNLPVASDIRAFLPDAAIEWVAEAPYAAIPRLHRAVETVIPVAIRRWRKAPWRSAVRAEIGALWRRLRERRYDAVIDTQGLLKSALIARMSRGPRYGLDWASSREPLALFYDRTFSVPWTLHAVERNRSLAAQALGYAPPATVDYGLRVAPRAWEWLPPAPPCVALLHATSAARKLWPEAEWVETGRHFSARGAVSVLPWGDATERARSIRLAAQIPGAVVPPALALDEAAALLAGARAVIGVDTGLVHLAAALGTPTVGVYCATDPAATGIYGCPRAVNVGGRGRPPQAAAVIAAVERLAWEERGLAPDRRQAGSHQNRCDE
ncbi:MAG: lipopolysaccharide heptosyltransferase I [Burkholderiales bacterium]